MKSIVYWNSFIYSLFIRFSYKGNYLKRYQAIQSLVEPNSSVVDVCCGDCKIYEFLSEKNVAYTGLDFNPTFVKEAKQNGLKAREFNVYKDEIPAADYVLMQASLYQFIPRHGEVLKKLFDAAGKYLIIAEPIKNHADSGSKIVSYLAKKLNDPGDGIKTARFNAQTLKEALNPYRQGVIKEQLVGDTEYVVLIRKS